MIKLRTVSMSGHWQLFKELLERLPEKRQTKMHFQ